MTDTAPVGCRRRDLPARMLAAGAWARSATAAVGLGAAAAWAPREALAGAQLEEPLADAVRTAMSAAIAAAPPPRPTFPDTAARLAYLQWLIACSRRLQRYVASPNTRQDLLQTVWYESARAGLDRSLVLGLMQVESGFRKYAVSSAGARGYMQVMPFWARQIGEGQVSRLFHLQTNLRFGCVILRHYVDVERGDLYLSLGRYNGSRGRPEYPRAVFAAQKGWIA